ncbi:uncharacterized protein LOC135219817 [Macrobrachium nipponense]|uniref:uncharacterized protein LOC135219817 n=1 Tax=Macrobrachium nipponense TaxID=159736 RepID=UPI0030C8B4A5
MASPPVNAHEVAMTEDLSRFWSTMSRKFEWDRPHHRAFNVSSQDPWDNLVANESQPSVSPTFLKRDSRERQEEPFLGELSDVDHLKSHDDLLEECEFRSSETDWASSLEDSLPKVQQTHQERQERVVLDGALIGDIPTKYVISGLQNHELPVIGTYVDPLIVAGFNYNVRPADSRKLLFQGRALRLVSISKGYGKRITFASDSHNENSNYFYSDTNPEGFGFSIKLVQEDEKFTLRDANDTPVATAEVAKLVGPHKEIGQRFLEDNSVEKRARVSMVCKVHYFHLSHAEPKLILITGEAVSIKPQKPGSPAVLKRVIKCNVGGERGLTLEAGVDNSTITVVNGQKTGDIPLQYSITGLQPYELPVVGTYVDPSILTGFRYRVRPVDSKKHLFGARALTLQSIGRGYGKRLTFSGDKMNQNENYFWSDTNPEGYGFSIQAVAPGDAFRIMSSSGEDLGRAQVFRADAPQVEEKTEVSAADGKVTKRVRVTVTCDVSFHEEDDQTVIVTGTAVVVRKGRTAQVQRLEDVAVSSKINLIFAHDTETLIFVRE